MRAGDEVTIVGLVQAAHNNDRTGVILSINPKQNACSVKMDEDKAPPHRRSRSESAEDNSKFVGHRRAKSAMPSMGRIAAKNSSKPKGGEILKLKLQNLKRRPKQVIRIAYPPLPLSSSLL